MATIADVARAAGVGVGTVSRVLNKSPLVRAETRQRVLEAIDELDYTPSSVARRLALGTTQTIAVVLPFLTHPSAVERMRGVISALRGTAYDFIVFDVEMPEHRGEYLNVISRGARADGILVLSLPPSDSDVEQLIRASLAVVLVDARHDRLSHLTIDDEEGGASAARHLLELGHRRIAFVGDPVDNPFGFTSSSDREAGFRNELEQHDVRLDPDLVRHGPHGRRVAHVQAAELLALPEPPTAIFAASDTQALGVLEAAAEAGVTVPHELSVIGFDDIEIASYVGLTTIRQPLFESGRRGAEMLLAALGDAGDPAPLSETLPLELVVRKTTGPRPDG